MSDQRPFNIFYFPTGLPPDDLQDLFRQIRSQSKSKDHTILRQFLDNSTCILRDEIRQLPESFKHLLPPLGNAVDLVDLPNWQRGPLAGTVEGVLMCLLHLSSFIG